MKHLFLIVLFLIPSFAFAEDKKISLMEPLSIGSVIQVFAGLAAVLLLFGGLVFVLKRMGGFRAAQGGKMYVVEGVSISTRDRVLLMQVGEKQVLIGVSPNGISPIKVFDEAVITVDESHENSFSGQLKKQLNKRSSSESKKSQGSL